MRCLLLRMLDAVESAQFQGFEISIAALTSPLPYARHIGLPLASHSRGAVLLPR